MSSDSLLLSLQSCVCVLLSRFSNVRLFVPGAHQDLLSMGFPKQDYCSGLPYLPPGNLPNSESESTPHMSPTLSGFFTTRTTWEVHALPS